MNPRKLQQMMEQMGIDVTDIDATEVRIHTESGETLVFDAPEVTQMDAQGQRTYQVVGEPETVDEAEASESEAAETEEASIPEDDIEIVVARTGESAEAARAALEETNGDLAAAIDRLS